VLKQATVLMRGQGWHSGENTRLGPPREPRGSKPDIDAVCEMSLLMDIYSPPKKKKKK